MPTLNEDDYKNSDSPTIKNRLEELKLQTTFSAIDTAEIKVAIKELQKRVNNNPATELQESSDSLLLIQQKILESQEDLKIAEDRVKTLRNVDKKPSYYESWFPINRPLRSSSIIVCFIFGIFFFSLSFFMFMRFLGLSFTVDISWLTPGNIELYSKILPYGAGIIIVGLIILTIVAWVRKS